MRVSAGTSVITQGDPGDRYYAVADGELTIVRDGKLVQTATRGDGFGEIALLQDVPRMASVTAVTDALLYSLEKEPFVETLTGHVSAASVARSVIARHLGTENR